MGQSYGCPFSLGDTMKAKNGFVGQGMKFERIRRITGYLVGTLDRFNNGKRAEEKDRVKHSMTKE